MPSAPKTSDEPLRQLAATFAQLASAITRRQPDEAIAGLIKELHTGCRQTTAMRSDAQRALVANLTLAVETWQRVWPRLGGQQEFRQAVAREAELWSKRLHAMGEGRGAS